MTPTDTPLNPAAIAELIARYERDAKCAEDTIRTHGHILGVTQVQERLAAEARHIARALAAWQLIESGRVVLVAERRSGGFEATAASGAPIFAQAADPISAVLALAATPDARDGAK